nr:Centrosomal protein of 76 kDa [Polyrhizophydium stewartii]
MELGLRQYIAHFREDHDLATVWDDDLGHLLGQSLWTCEHQRLMGSASVAAFMDDFQTSVKRQIPEGHTFKGFPCQFNHWHTSRVFSTLAKTAQCRAILQTTGDKVRFAARARVFAYPETAASCWVMVGVRFQSA